LFRWDHRSFVQWPLVQGKESAVPIFVGQFERDGCRQTKTWQQRGTLWNYQRIETI
jgi:hypothetical protein